MLQYMEMYILFGSKKDERDKKIACIVDCLMKYIPDENYRDLAINILISYWFDIINACPKEQKELLARLLLLPIEIQLKIKKDYAYIEGKDEECSVIFATPKALRREQHDGNQIERSAILKFAKTYGIDGNTNGDTIYYSGEEQMPTRESLSEKEAELERNKGILAKMADYLKELMERSGLSGPTH